MKFKIKLEDVIVETVCNFHNVSIEDVKSETRKRRVTIVRQLCMYFLKEYTKFSLTAIAYTLGNRDHSTTIHGIRQVKGLSDVDKNFREMLSTCNLAVLSALQQYAECGCGKQLYKIEAYKICDIVLCFNCYKKANVDPMVNTEYNSLRSIVNSFNKVNAAQP